MRIADGPLPLLLGQPDLLCEGVQVAHQRHHDLAQARASGLVEARHHAAVISSGVVGELWWGVSDMCRFSLGYRGRSLPSGDDGALANPYQTLGVAASATDAELRAAYRRLVQLHHPDHNGGSPESARRFEEVQEAYAEVRRRRAAGGSSAGAQDVGGRARVGTSKLPEGLGGDPDLDARLAAMEQELKGARDARDRAAREARRATEQTIRDVREMAGKRPSDEDLGYYTTSDSFSQILDDAAVELSERFTEARESPAGHRVSDIIDEFAHKLTGDHDRKPK